MGLAPTNAEEYVIRNGRASINTLETRRETIGGQVGAGAHMKSRRQQEVAEVADRQSPDPRDVRYIDRRRHLGALELQKPPVLLDPLRAPVDLIRACELVRRLEENRVGDAVNLVVPAPEQRRGEGAVSLRPVVERSSRPVQVSRRGGFRFVKERVRNLRGPARGERKLHPSSGRIDPSAFDVPAMLVRLRAVEYRSFDGDGFPARAERGHVEGDVCRILPVMPEGGRGVLSGGGPV